MIVLDKTRLIGRLPLVLVWLAHALLVKILPSQDKKLELFKLEIKMNVLTRVALLFAISIASGCASSSHVLIGQIRPPIDVSQVKVYADPPMKYEKIALIEGSSKNSFAVSDQGKSDKALLNMKKEAALLGANGVLIQAVGDISTGMVGTNTFTGSGGYGSSVGIYGAAMHKSAQGIAIYVLQE